jgi:hypothetical protein
MRKMGVLFQWQRIAFRLRTIAEFIQEGHSYPAMILSDITSRELKRCCFAPISSDIQNDISAMFGVLSLLIVVELPVQDDIDALKKTIRTNILGNLLIQRRLLHSSTSNDLGLFFLLPKHLQVYILECSYTGM